jgi:hypothetical protein
LEGAVSTDEFYPLPEYVASLIPPTDEPVSFDRFVAEHGVEDEEEEASFFARPQEGSSGIDELGDQGLGSSIEDGGAEERGSDAHNLDRGLGSDIPQAATCTHGRPEREDDIPVAPLYYSSGGEGEGTLRGLLLREQPISKV